MKVRQLALRTLMRMQSSAGYSNLTLDAVIKSDPGVSDPRDRALLTSLVMGVVQRQTTLDYYIDHLLTNGTQPEPEVRMALRLGLYQLMYLDLRMPLSAKRWIRRRAGRRAWSTRCCANICAGVAIYVCPTGVSAAGRHILR